MQKKIAILSTVAALALAACGDTDLERGATGAAAGAGAAILLDGNVLTGALIGGAAGALCDDLTNQC